MLNIYKTINLFGIVAFILLFLAFLIGITQGSFTFHYYFAIMAFLFACSHVGLIFYRNYKKKKRR